MIAFSRISTRAAIAAVSLCAAALAGCVDRDVAESTVAPLTPSVGRTMFLGLSNLTPGAGDEVVVSINTVAPKGAAVGSFKVRLGYDTKGLRFLAALPSTEGMVIANPVRDTIIVVGASGEGFTSRTLASVRLKVTDPAAVASLHLDVVALASTGFTSEAAATSVDRRVFRGNVIPK
jgi:hypothetical protein